MNIIEYHLGGRRSKSPKGRGASPKGSRSSRAASGKGKKGKGNKTPEPEVPKSSEGIGRRIVWVELYTFVHETDTNYVMGPVSICKMSKWAEPLTSYTCLCISICSIPLVPRRPVSPDADARTGPTPSKDKKDKKGGKKVDETPGIESPAPPQDLDEKLIFDGYTFAVSSITTMVCIYCTSATYIYSHSKRIARSSKHLWVFHSTYLFHTKANYLWFHYMCLNS